jgi:hypothetical protein
MTTLFFWTFGLIYLNLKIGCTNIKLKYVANLTKKKTQTFIVTWYLP